MIQLLKNFNIVLGNLVTDYFGHFSWALKSTRGSFHTAPRVTTCARPLAIVTAVRRTNQGRNDATGQEYSSSVGTQQPLTATGRAWKLRIL